MKQKDSQYIEIDLVKLFTALLRRIWVIILAAIVCGGAAFAYARFMIAPTYNADALFYVNNNSISVGNTKVSISSSDITAAQSLVDTYIVILNSRTTLNEVIKKAEVDYTYAQLKSMISAQSVSSTEIFSVQVTSTDKNEAQKIANTIVKVLPQRISEVVDGSSARIVDYAVTPGQKAGPNVTKITAVGIAVGVLLSCAVIAVLQLIDTVIHDEDYLLKTYPNIPVLAVIPDLAGGSSSGKHSEKYGRYDSAGEYSEKGDK